jgi:hypothetical protein
MNITPIPERPKIDNIPPGMDLRQLPIGMLTDTLREWAQNLVTNTLNIDIQFEAHINDKLLQMLLPYLRPRTTFSLWQKRIISQILTGFPQPSVEKIQQNPVALTIVQSLKQSPKNVESKKSPKYMPDALWPLIGAMAWDDSVFQSRLATEIAAALRKRFLFLNGELPKISLRPEVFWLILELTHSVPTIHQITRQCYQHGGWAGFWEQWLLMELLQRSVIQLKPELKDLLIGLPILSLSNYGKLKKKLMRDNIPKPPSIVDHKWHQAVPSWFEQMPDW